MIVIPGRAERANPESRHALIHFWIPGPVQTDRPGMTKPGRNLPARAGTPVRDSIVPKRAGARPSRKPTAARSGPAAGRRRRGAPKGAALWETRVSHTETGAPFGAPHPRCFEGEKFVPAKAGKEVGLPGASNNTGDESRPRFLLPSPLVGEGAERSEAGEGSESIMGTDPSPGSRFADRSARSTLSHKGRG